MTNIRHAIYVYILVSSSLLVGCSPFPNKPPNLREAYPAASFQVPDSILSVPVSVDMTHLSSTISDELDDFRKSDTVEVDANVSVEIINFLHKAVKKPTVKLVNKVRDEKRRASSKCKKIFGKLFAKVVCEPVYEVVKVAIQVPETVFEIIEEPYTEIVKSTMNTKARVSYDIELSTFEATLNGNNLTMVGEFDYGIRLGVKQDLLGVKTTISGVSECGMNGDPRSIIRVTISGAIGLSENQKLTFTRNSKKIEWPKKCQLTAADIQLDDILDLPFIDKAFDRAVEKGLSKLPSEYDLRPTIEQAWANLYNPIKLGDDIFLYINPKNAWLMPITGEQEKLHTGMGLTAKPVISTGKLSGLIEKPLPKTLEIKTTSSSINLAVEGRLSFERATSELKKQIARLDLGKYASLITIDDAVVYPGLNGAMVIGLTLSRPFVGHVYLEGRPQYIIETGVIEFSNLNFEIDSRNYIANTAAWIFDSNIESLLQNNVSWGLDKESKKILEKIKSYDLTFGHGKLTGTTQSLTPVEIYLSRDYLHLILNANGKADLLIAEMDKKIGASKYP